jgi:hypothetical protein
MEMERPRRVLGIYDGHNCNAAFVTGGSEQDDLTQVGKDTHLHHEIPLVRVAKCLNGHSRMIHNALNTAVS